MIVTWTVTAAAAVTVPQTVERPRPGARHVGPDSAAFQRLFQPIYGVTSVRRRRGSKVGQGLTTLSDF